MILLGYFVDVTLINIEVSKCGKNIGNGFIDMKRDINLKLIPHHPDSNVTRQVFCSDILFFEWKDYFLFERMISFHSFIY
jgi:hypothetical protein